MKIGNVASAPASVASTELSQRRNVSAESPQVNDIAVNEGMTNQRSQGQSVQKSEQIDDEVLEKSVEQANKTLKKHDRYIERNVHEVTKAIMYKLKDSETNEVIAEFPPQKVQDMIAKMWELAGLFVDGKG